jgi:hypothetical protein
MLFFLKKDHRPDDIQKGRQSQFGIRDAKAILVTHSQSLLEGEMVTSGLVSKSILFFPTQSASHEMRLLPSSEAFLPQDSSSVLPMTRPAIREPLSPGRVLMSLSRTERCGDDPDSQSPCRECTHATNPIERNP